MIKKCLSGNKCLQSKCNNFKPHSSTCHLRDLLLDLVYKKISKSRECYIIQQLESMLQNMVTDEKNNNSFR